MLCDGGRQGGVLKPTKNNHFQVFLAVWVFFLKFLCSLRSSLMIRVSHVMTFPILFILFYDRDWQGEVFKVMKKWLFFSVVSHLDPFPLVFGQIKEWLMLELHERIRMPHAVSCPFVFILFYGQDWEGSVLKAQF